MHKVLSILFVISLALALTGCGPVQPSGENGGNDGTAANTTVRDEERSEAADDADKIASDDRMVRAWKSETAPEVPDEVRTMLERASTRQDGMTYTPIAHAAAQAASGCSHYVLCAASADAPDAAQKYALVTMLEDPDGNAEITQVYESAVETGRQGLTGGWNVPDTPLMTEKANNALKKATSILTGAEYSPVALLSTQVVAGTNYRILCVVSPIVPDTEEEIMIVQVYEDLQGNAEVTEISSFSAETAQQ